jgi:threonine 3-dehydrogenase
MVVGHEFVGEIVEVGSNVADFRPGRSSAARARGLRPLPQLPGRPAAPVRRTKGIGVDRPAPSPSTWCCR